MSRAPAMAMGTLCLSFFLFGATVAAHGQAPDRAQVREAERAALRNRDFAEAIRLLQDGLRQFPGDTELMVDLGRAYLYSHEDERAIQLFQEVLRKEPGNASAKLQLARALAYRRDYQGSDRLYRELLQANPADEDAAVGLISNLIRERRHADARRELADALVAHPKSARLQRELRRLQRQSVAQEEGGRQRVQHKNRVAFAQDYITDSAQNHSLRLAQSVENQLLPSLTNYLHLEERTLWNASRRRAHVLAAGSEIQYRLAKRWTVSAQGGAVRFADGNTRALYRAELQFNPRRELQISGGFGRNYVSPTYRSTLFDLLAEGWNARLDWNSQAWRAQVQWSNLHYSDGNHIQRESAELIRWIGKPRFAVAAGYRVRHIDSRKTLAHGYFDPSSYQNHVGVTGVRFRAGRHFRGEYLVRVGQEMVAARPHRLAWETVLRNYLTWGNWEMGLDYSYFRRSENTGAFNSHAPRVVIAYRF